jgi:hypothetical protein
LDEIRTTEGGAIVNKKWLPDNDLVSHSCPRWAINEYLTKTYGSPPIVRTYNGESAETFGITSDTSIHYWNEVWFSEQFKNLTKGDCWMLQPPAPKPLT